MNKTLASTALVALCAFAGTSAVAGTSSTFEGNMRDAWLTGRIESMYLLNEHLSPFSITTEVDSGVVMLTGTVDSDVDRDLAGVLAGNFDGVVEVKNELVVDAEAAKSSSDSESSKRRNFGSWVDDATTTAAVKSRLIRNANTKGLQIDVDTREDVVTLSGRVETAEVKALAEELARNASDVVDVHNNLVVDPS